MRDACLRIRNQNLNFHRGKLGLIFLHRQEESHDHSEENPKLNRSSDEGQANKKSPRQEMLLNAIFILNTYG